MYKLLILPNCYLYITNLIEVNNCYSRYQTNLSKQLIILLH